MRNLIAGLSMLLCAPAFAQQQTPPIINFESVPNPLQLPDNMYFGEVSGIAVNSKGHVFVLSRGNTTGPAYAAAATQLLEFNADGKFFREIGHNLYAWSFAHMVKVDRHDNIWVTDKGSDMVIKFTPEGRVAMVFGRKQEASDEETGPLKHPKPPLPAEPGRFRQVTDTAFDAADNTFISDGYINSRIAKVDKDGNWIKSWGERGSGPGQFITPHAIATDDKGNVYVADRGNHRIQVFDNNGNFKSSITSGGDPEAICISPGAHQYLFSSNSNPQNDLDHGGEIYKLELNGTVAGKFGQAGKGPKDFGSVNAIDCRSPSALYVAEAGNWRVTKVALH